MTNHKTITNFLSNPFWQLEYWEDSALDDTVDETNIFSDWYAGIMFIGNDVFGDFLQWLNSYQSNFEEKLK